MILIIRFFKETFYILIFMPIKKSICNSPPLRYFSFFGGSVGGHLTEDWQDSKGEGDYTPHSGGDWGPPGHHLPGGGGAGLEEGGLRDPLLIDQQGFKSPGFDNSNQSGN